MRWTARERAQVDAAILSVARRNLYFTADEIWGELPGDFPVSKGLSARLRRASRGGAVENTGSTTVKRGAWGPRSHRQRLSVWRSRVCSSREGC